MANILLNGLTFEERVTDLYNKSVANGWKSIYFWYNPPYGTGCSRYKNFKKGVPNKADIRFFLKRTLKSSGSGKYHHIRGSRTFEESSISFNIQKVDVIRL